MNQFEPFAIDKEEVVTARALADPSEWRLLRRLHVPGRFNEPLPGNTIKRALIVDVETTGLSIATDDVIQLAMLPFDYEVETGRVLTVHKSEAFGGLRQPAVPISREASLITGITDEMVAGKHIDPGEVDERVLRADLVIAHNSRFDRPMVEHHWPRFVEKPWACTLESVDWLEEGFTAGKLDYLGMRFGWFYEGHRALSDCEACLALLAQTLPASGTQVMSKVRTAALRKECLVLATGAPLDLREKLKERKYQWRPDGMPNGRVWWIAVEDAEAEIDWLQREVFGRKIPIRTHPVTALNRYSERIWDFE
jgi:DNA polymerase-3 subunit epsilon